MTAYNVVRFRVKPGNDQAFIDIFRNEAMPAGARKGALIKTGERSYCFIAEWDSMDAIAAARPEMIATLDKGRHLLEDLGGGLGVTDPVSGDTVFET